MEIDPTLKKTPSRETTCHASGLNFDLTWQPRCSVRHFRRVYRDVRIFAFWSRSSHKGFQTSFNIEKSISTYEILPSLLPNVQIHQNIHSRCTCDFAKIFSTQEILAWLWISCNIRRHLEKRRKKLLLSISIAEWSFLEIITIQRHLVLLMNEGVNPSSYIFVGWVVDADRWYIPTYLHCISFAWVGLA